mmetsp:Transcript_37643/g.70372  ORF Transcript_37643/g.70372 Transcript_37643/m.70372 type:complete len:531 (+) Transcript_37643:43-1635(+)
MLQVVRLKAACTLLQSSSAEVVCRTACASKLPRQRVSGARSFATYPELEREGDGAAQLYLRRPGAHGFSRCNFLRNRLGRAVEDNYVFDEVLGKGKAGMSEVWNAYHCKTGVQVAVKIVHKKRSVDLDALMRELEFLKVTDHPNIIRLYEIFEDENRLCLVLEYCRGGDLQEHILSRHRSGLGFSEQEVKEITQDMLRAVAYCHAQSIVHRDIKPSNFMFAPRLKLLDFGVSGVVPRSNPSSRLLKAVTGTTGYMAPEIIMGRAYGPAADMFSLGVTMFHLITGKLPIWLEGVGCYHFPKSDQLQLLSADALHLLSSLLAKTPGVRPTANGALRCTWLTNGNSSSDSSDFAHLDESRVKKLKLHRKRSKLQRAARTSMIACSSMNDPELEELESEFLQISRKNDGEIDHRDLKATMRLRNSMEAASLLADLDTSQNGTLCLSEWLVAASSSKIFTSKKAAQRAFDALDSDCDGLISATELHKILPHVFKEDELDSQMKRYDKDGDRHINFEEFFELLNEDVFDDVYESAT